MYFEGSNGQLTAVGHLMVHNVQGAFDSLASFANDTMARQANNENSYVAPETRQNELSLVDQALKNGELTADQAKLLTEMKDGSLHELMKMVGLKFETLSQGQENGDKTISGDIKLENIADKETQNILKAAGKENGDIIQFKVNDRTGEVFFKVGFDQAHLAGFVGALVKDKNQAATIIAGFNKLGADTKFVAEFTTNKGLGGSIVGVVNFGNIKDAAVRNAVGNLGYQGNDEVQVNYDLRSGKFTLDSKVNFKSVDALENKTGVKFDGSAKKTLMAVEAARGVMGVKANITGLLAGTDSNVTAEGYLFAGADAALLDTSSLFGDSGKTLELMKGLGGASVSGQLDGDGGVRETVIVPTNMAAVVEWVNAQKGADLEGTPLGALARTNLDLPADSIRKMSFNFSMREDGVPVQITTLEVRADKVTETTREKLTAAGITPVKEDGFSVYKFELVTTAIDGTHVYQTGGSEKAATHALEGTGIEAKLTLQGKTVNAQLGPVEADGTRKVMEIKPLSLDSGEIMEGSRLLLTLDGSADLTATRVVEGKTGGYSIVEFKLVVGDQGLGAQFPTTPSDTEGAKSRFPVSRSSTGTGPNASPKSVTATTNRSSRFKRTREGSGAI
ncbi:MAG: hypothetical protein IPP35_00630 [Elusimicrobia bacterium]|nr:hypothetical protein [Elusimicrobiota bacterium]